jgi:cellulose biosynthesis protein BcsQ
MMGRYQSLGSAFVRIVAFFNHKGGVGKTTLVYNIGLALAEQGKRVLFVDADAQANLTSAALALEKIESLFDKDETIHGCLSPVIDGSGDIASSVPTQIRETAWIIAGDIRLSDFEEIAPEGWTQALAGNARGFRVSTAMYRVIRDAGEQLGADIAFVDLGPNVGALNRTVILGSTGFVIPLAPDLFSLTALPSVGKSAALWVAEWQAALGSAARRSLNLNFELPDGRPSPLGYVSQQFAVYRQAPAAAYKRWIEQIPEAYRAGVVEPLDQAGVPIPARAPLIGEVRNFSSLIPMAQRTQRAVFELTGSEARGAQFTRARDTYSLFGQLADEIVGRLDEVAAVAEDSS